MWKLTILSLLHALGHAKWGKKVALYEIKALDKFQVRALYDAYSTAPTTALSKPTRKDDGGVGRIVHSREMYEDNLRGTIVFDCTSLCGGIGDRLKGITYLFLTASHLRANLKIKWPSVRHVWTLKPSYDYFKWNTGGQSDRAVRIDATSEDVHLGRFQRLLSDNFTIFVRLNRFPQNSTLFEQMNLSRPFWTYIGHVWKHLYSASPDAEAMISTVPRCDACVYARIGDSTIGRGETYRREFHLQVACATRMTTNCVHIATDNEGFKHLYRNLSFIRTFRKEDRDSNRSHRHASTLNEMLYLSRCRHLICATNGYSLVARSIADAANEESSVWSPSCSQKGAHDSSALDHIHNVVD